MAKALVTYYSRGGNTRKMAELISEAIKKEGVDTVLKDVKDVAAGELPDFDAVIIGSPTYYGGMSAEIKRLLDDSVEFHGKLDGKVGAAFTSSNNIGGGNETAILSILNALLIHGMIIQGDPKGDHYGAVAIGFPDKRAVEQCVKLGRRTAKLIKKAAG